MSLAEDVASEKGKFQPARPVWEPRSKRRHRGYWRQISRAKRVDQVWGADFNDDWEMRKGRSYMFI